jgi:DNA-binding CsgD family transcriptional regulator
MDRQPSKSDRRAYFRKYNRSRPLDARINDEPATYLFQLTGDRNRADADEFYSLRIAVLNRALLDLQNAHDVRQGLRHFLEDPCDFDGECSDIEAYFMEETHAIFHACDAPEATTPAEDSQVIQSAPTRAGWYEIVPSDGVFAFPKVCESLGIPIESARAIIRTWIEKRKSGETLRLVPDNRRRDLSPRPPRARPARRQLTTDELLTPRTSKTESILTMRREGRTVREIVDALDVSENTIRAALRRRRDDLPQDIRPRLRAVREAKNQRDLEVCLRRAFGESRAELSDRFGLAAPTIGSILNEHARAIRKVLVACNI